MINGFDNEEIWNPNKHFGVGPIEKDVSFGEVWKATYQRVTSPIITHIQNAKTFKGYDGVDDPEFNLKMEMFKPKHYPYINTFGDVTSQPELTARLQDLDERIEVRETLASAPYKYLIPAELLNPINALALPFGVGEARFFASIAKVGLSNAIIEGGFEAVRAPFDPTSIPYETPINMGAAFVFGGFLQGLIRTPSAIKARNLNKLMDDYNALTKGLDDLTPEEINNMPSVKDRAYGKYTNDQLKKLIKNTKNTQEIYNLNRELSVRTIEYWKTKDPNDIYKKDNFFLRFVPVPFKSFLNSNLTKTKEYMHKLGGDHALMTIGNLMGLTQGPSIYTLAKLHTSKVIVLRAQLQKLWGEEIGGMTEGAGMNLTNTGNKLANLNPLQKNRMTMEDWMIEVNKARIADDPSYRMSVKQKEAAELITKFFKNEEVELRKLGLIGSVDSFKKNITRLTSSLDDANAKLKLPTNKKATASLKRRQARLEKEIKEQEALLEEASNRPVMPANETVYFPRYFDMTKIKANRVGFTKAIINHYSRTSTNKSDTIESITLRAEETVKKILEEGEYDPLNPDSIFMGIGASKHQLGRKLDISNKEILEFIEADPIKVMDEYVKRLGPRIEWEKMYGGRSIDDLLDEIDEDGISNNMSTAKINKARKEFLVMYDRIVGRVVDDPSRIDNKIAYVMKSAAGLNFLGSAGLATITEPAVMFMNHEVGTVFKNLFALLKRAPEIQQALRETKEQYAEALEMEIGGAQIRLSDEMRGQSKTAKVWEKGTDAFYKLNGLAPLTAFLKHWESLNRQHSIIDYSIKWVNAVNAKSNTTTTVKTTATSTSTTTITRGTKPKANTFEQHWLLRNGIDFKTAEKIAKSPWQKGASGLYLANISNWKSNIDMPITKADIVVGPIKGRGRNKSAFFRQSEGPNGTIYIDEEYVAAQFDSKPWTNPKVKGVKPLPADAFKTPQEWVEFVKIHEIMHSNNSAKSLGIKDKRTALGKADYENVINDMALTEIRNQQEGLVEKSTTEKFRAAMTDGILNTILMGTPADKPILADGVMFLPMHIASTMGLKEHPRYRGYARVESGFLNMPLQFYSYLMAAANKIQGSMVQGQNKNKAITIAAFMGLGYLQYELRVPDWVKEKDSWDTKMLRAFDYGGLGGIYSDLLYTGLHTGIEMTGKNFTNGMVSAKYGAEQNLADGVAGLLGAGPDISLSYGRASADIFQGKFGEGTQEFLQILPFLKLWFIKKEMRELGRTFGRMD